MTPTIPQRLGLGKVALDSAAHERLVAARAAAALYSVQATVAIVAATVGGGLSLVIPCAIVAYAVAAVVILGYQHLTIRTRSVLALTAPVILAVLVLGMPNGIRYAWLATLLVLYIGFFYSRRHAAAHVACITVALAAAIFARYPHAVALEAVIVLGSVLIGVGVTAGILRRRLAALVVEAKSAKAEIDALFNFAPAGFGLLDEELRHVRVNDALAEVMALPRSEIVGRTLLETAPFNGPVLDALAKSVLESGRPVLNAEITSPDGSRYQLVSYYPVPGPRGTIGVGTSVTDVTHLKDVERRLEETNARLTVLATTDELTRLPNRRMFSEQLDLALARARRGGLAVAVLYLDLDGFKDVNDAYGHGYGDEMLVAIAARLRAGARATDVVARVGGDEFLVLLSDLDVQDAPALVATVADRIREQLAEPVTIGPLELKVTASIGNAIYPLDGRDATALLAAADASMYAGKGAVARVA